MWMWHRVAKGFKAKVLKKYKFCFLNMISFSLLHGLYIIHKSITAAQYTWDDLQHGLQHGRIRPYPWYRRPQPIIRIVHALLGLPDSMLASTCQGTTMFTLHIIGKWYDLEENGEADQERDQGRNERARYRPMRARETLAPCWMMGVKALLALRLSQGMIDMILAVRTKEFTVTHQCLAIITLNQQLQHVVFYEKMSQ